MIKLSIAVCCAIILSSCSKSIKQLETPVLPDQFAIERYTSTNSTSVFKVDSLQSDVMITVRRGGLMAKLGHDHIVSSRQLQGFILMDQDNQRCHADFYIPVHLMEVDNPQLRAQAQMQTTPSDKDIAGTRINMLKSINAKQFPFVQLRSADCSEIFTTSSVAIEIQLHGVTRNQQIDFNWHRDKAGVLTAQSTFSLLQTDFNIAPFSIMNGLIKVEDKLEIDVQLTAHLLETTRQ